MNNLLKEIKSEKLDQKSNFTFIIRFTLFTPEGIKKEVREVNVDIGGPLCFQVTF